LDPLGLIDSTDVIQVDIVNVVYRAAAV